MKSIPWLATLLALTLSASSISAQEEGAPVEIDQEQVLEEGVAEEHVDEGPLGVVFRWINFIVLFGGLGYLLRKPATEFFETRRAAILGGLDRARAAQKDASARMADIEGRLAQLSGEIAAIQASADESARRERERIVKETRGEVERALAQSRAEVDRLARSMEQEIRSQVADLVIARAEAALRDRITESDHERLVRRAVEEF